VEPRPLNGSTALGSVGDRHPLLALQRGIERAIEPRRLDELGDDRIPDPLRIVERAVGEAQRDAVELLSRARPRRRRA